MTCSQCGSPDHFVIESRLTNDGAARRRRIACRQCGYRITTYTDVHTGAPVAQPERKPPVRDLAKPRYYKLDESRVLEILQRIELSDGAMAQAVGCSRQMVASIRTGGAHAQLRPDIPRRSVRHGLTAGEVEDILEQASQGMPLTDIAWDYELPEWRIRQVVERSVHRTGQPSFA